MDTDTINHVSLCSGYGGIDLGLKRAIGRSLRTVAYVEVESFAVANLVAKASQELLDEAPVWSDLRSFPWGKFHGLVDILSGGYPCQPFSAAGKRLGAEDPRHLWPFISAGIALMRPSVCFFENVEGHISLGLSDVLQDLVGLGYRATWCVASASECGAPHQRKRIFILAYCKEQGLEGYRRLLTDGVWDDAGQSSTASGMVNAGISSANAQPSQCWSRDVSRQGTAGESGCPWPSRPGEQQFAWEPPRVVGNATQRQDHGREPGDLGTAPSQGRCGDHAADGAGEAMGNASSLRLEHSGEPSGLAEASGRAEGQGSELAFATEESSDPRSGEGVGNAAHTNRRSRVSAEEAGAGPDDIWRRRSGESGERETQQPMGLRAHGTESRLGIAELSGLSDQELAEIRHWMVASDNRTDELRLLGNGVVPACAERAFRLLVGELMEHQP